MCDFSTANHYKLKEHCRSHTREKIFACNTCGGMFASRTKLVDHLVRQNSSGCKCGIYLVCYYLIKNGNRTEWSPIQSVIAHFVNHEYDYGPNWMTERPITDKLLIVTITISKETNLFFFCERAFNTNNLSKIRENTFGRDTLSSVTNFTILKISSLV